MPTVAGRMIPNLDTLPTATNELLILILKPQDFDLIALSTQLEMLNEYITDSSRSPLQITVALPETSRSPMNEALEYTFIDAANEEPTTINSLIKEHDVDVVYGLAETTVTELRNNYTPVEFAETTDEVALYVESFLTGEGIAWSMADPVWNATWLVKYHKTDPLTVRALELLNKSQTSLGYSPVQIGFARALANKVAQVRHAEELILSLVIKKNASHRNGTTTDLYGYEAYYDYSFEISYQLGTYYFLMSGCFDILGRFFSDLYSLTLSQGKQNIEQPDFKTAVETHNPQLNTFLEDTDALNWITWLKRRRNFAAHAGSLTYSDVLQAKEIPLTAAQVSGRINALPAITDLASNLPQAVGAAVLAQAEFFIRLHEDNEIVTHDAMIVEGFDLVERITKKYLSHPLLDTKYDYSQFSGLITRILVSIQ